MVAPGRGSVFADLAAAWGGAQRKPAASLDELLQELPAEQREEVRAFLREQELEELEDLAAVTVGDLTEAFKAKPAEFTLGHRSAVRSLCTLAQERREAVAATAVQEARRELRAARRRGALVALLLVALGFVNCFGTWSAYTSFDEYQCLKDVDGKSSGLKVIVAGFDGTGSQPILDALQQMGINSHNSEDFSFFVWSRLARDFWRRPENGKRGRPPLPRPPLSALLDLPLKDLWGRPSYRPLSTEDVQVLNGTQPGDLAAAVARCRIKAVALDGMERLIWPLYRVSDGVKVISLSNMPYREYMQQLHAPPGLELDNLAWAILTASQYVLPWGAVYKVLDLVQGVPARLRLSQGKLPFSQGADAHSVFVYVAEYFHRVRRHAYGGLSMRPDKSTYDRFHMTFRKQVPESRLLEFDPRVHTWKDLCDFLEVHPCPQAGLVGHGRFDGWTRVEWTFVIRLLFYLGFWVVNWKVVSFILRKLRGPALLVTKPVRVVLRPWRSLLSVRNVVKYFLAMNVAAYLEAYDFWGPLVRWEQKCENPPLPTNQSGVKVLVAGFAKSGTRTLSRTLWQLGMNGSFHSEELNMYYWGPHHDEYWMRPENGGRWPGPSFSRMHDFTKAYVQSDKEVLRNTPPQELAAGLSRCRVEAVAFDCIEELFWPIYDVSPNVKVISLSWRTYEEHQRSFDNFRKDFNMMCSVIGQIQGGVHGLPWVWVFKNLEFLVGSPITKMLKEGRPAACQVFTPFMALFHSLTGGRRILSHWYSGLAKYSMDKETYEDFYGTVRKRVPKERLFEWHMKKHKWEDLCKFLEVDPCPRTGKLERAINVFNFERDFPVCFLSRLPFYLLVHAVNWRVYGFVLRVVTALLRGLLSLVMVLKRCAGLGSSAKEE